jgi:hypothetical protein
MFWTAVIVVDATSDCCRIRPTDLDLYLPHADRHCRHHAALNSGRYERAGRRLDGRSRANVMSSLFSCRGADHDKIRLFHPGFRGAGPGR